jgi:hypothetical protein
MGIAMDSSEYTSSNLPGNPVLHERVYCGFGTIDIGNVKADQTVIGGRIQAFDNAIQMYFTPGPSSAVATARIYVTDGEIQVTGPNGRGWGYDDTTEELAAYNAGNFLNWTNLTLQNGWIAKANYYAPSYRFTPTGQIELRGVMTGGTIVDNTIVALMPIVPAKLSSYGGIGVAPTGAGTASKRVFYNTDGKLYCYGINAGGTTDLSLDGARFSYK